MSAIKNVDCKFVEKICQKKIVEKNLSTSTFFLSTIFNRQIFFRQILWTNLRSTFFIVDKTVGTPISRRCMNKRLSIFFFLLVFFLCNKFRPFISSVKYLSDRRQQISSKYVFFVGKLFESKVSELSLKKDICTYYSFIKIQSAHD